MVADTPSNSPHSFHQLPAPEVQSAMAALSSQEGNLIMQTAEEYRAELLKIMPDDPELVEATTLRYFRNLSKRKKPMKAGAKPGPHDSKAKHEEAMKNASDLMSRAYNRAKRGENVATPDDLLWSYSRNNYSQQGLEDQAESVRLQRERRAKIEALKISSSEPCFNCGAARSCEHREVTHG